MLQCMVMNLLMVMLYDTRILTCISIQITSSSRNHSILKNFWKKHYIPKNIKVVGIGVEHDSFVSLVNKYFNYPASAAALTLPPLPPTDQSIVKGGSYHIEIPEMKNAYTVLGFHSGGFLSKGFFLR